VDEGGKPTIIAVDSRQRPDLFDDIDLTDLAVIARQSPGDLIAILDAGWTEKRLPPSADEAWRSAWRHAPRNERTRPANRDLGPHKVARSLDGLTLEIGRLTFYDPSLKYEVVNYEDAVVEGLRPEPGPDSPSAERTFGLLCHGLTSALWRLDPAAASAQDWLDLAAEQWTGTATKETTYSPVIVGGAGLEKPLFSPPMRALVDALTRLERAPIAGLIPRLKRLIEKQKRPEDSLNLGLCHEALGEWNDAIEALNEVKEHEEASPGLRAEAEYALGRSLYERNEESDLDRAIGELRDATGRDPNLAGAFYYLGRALHDSARRNLLDLSVNAFRKYLEAGAPLGHRDEVRRWIARSTESR